MGDTTFPSVDELQEALSGQSYLADRGLATAIHLALSLDKPLLLEGEAGVGKTEVAKVLATLLGRRLIRLQCYEGIDASQALYEWNYSRQLIAVRAMDAAVAETHVEDLFGPDFLVERPLLAAIRAGSKAVLLVDELDRADDEFEAFLLEILSEFAVTIPEIGRVAAETPPAVVVTSNRTRELHDALKRRCLYHWIDHPDLEREVQIVRVRAPHVSEALARDVATAVLRLREMDLAKLPGVAETIDWANALAFLGADRLNGSLAADTLGAVVKDHEDQQMVTPRLAELVGDADRGARREPGRIDGAAEVERARPHDADHRLAAHYEKSWLTPDLLAGLSVWALVVPQALAYAEVVGVPAQYGLYTILALGVVCGVRLYAPGRYGPICLRGGGHRAGGRPLRCVDRSQLPGDDHRAHALRRRGVRPARRVPHGMGLELPRQSGAGRLHVRGRVRPDRRSAAEDPRDAQSRRLVLDVLVGVLKDLD